MRGGKFQQRVADETNSRNAEALFETRPVSAIRDAEVRTRKEIELKKEDLRQLVGASYRDLIESADSILEMRKSCEEVVRNISDMEKKFLGLQKSVSKSVKSFVSDESRKKREVLYGLGTRVKYLVDTPERIWGCLDEHMYLEGAERFLRSEIVHSFLVKPESAEGHDHSELLTKFPLLRHQWPLVETFREQIGQRSRNRLQEQGLSVAEYADALGATAVIEGLDSRSILALFVDSRRGWIRSHLRTSFSSSITLPGVAAALAALVSLIQTSLAHMGELFLEASSPASQESPALPPTLPLLFSVVLRASPASQVFGGIPSPEAEVDAWAARRSLLGEAVGPLGSRLIQEAAAAWLDDVASDVLGGEGLALLSKVRSCSDLSEVEAHVREAMAAPHNIQAASLAWLRSALGSQVQSPGDALWGLLLREPLSQFWVKVFEPAFQARARSVLDQSCADVAGVGRVFEKRLEEVSVADEDLKGIGDSLWEVSDSGDTSGDPISDTGGYYFSPAVAPLLQSLDSSLLSLLRDALSFLVSPQSPARLPSLAPHLQSGCMAAVHSLADHLQAHLDSLALQGADADPRQLATRVERSLFIGRFCLALANHSSALPVLMGPVDAWTAHASLAPPPRPSPAHSLPPRPSPLATLRLRLRQLHFSAHSLWLDSASLTLSGTFQEALLADASLAAPLPPRGGSWLETVHRSVLVEDGGDPGGEKLEVKMVLPAMASRGVLGFLFGAVREANARVAWEGMDRDVLRAFAWRLDHQVLAAYEGFVAEESRFGTSVSEKGLLQLLFDAKFVTDVLSGGCSISADSLSDDDSLPRFPSAPKRSRTLDASAASRKARVASLIDSLLQKLDPVDAAMYEDQLWQNCRVFYQRTAVLLGTLTALNPLPPPAQQDANKAGSTAVTVMDADAPAPRFALLPISAPVLPNVSSPRGVRARKPSSAADFAGSSGSYFGQWEEGDRSEGSGYLFGDLGLGFSGKSSNPLFKSFMGQMGSGAMRLGTMVSEGQVGRNITTLGDMLPSQATSLFSSLTA